MSQHLHSHTQHDFILPVKPCRKWQSPHLLFLLFLPFLPEEQSITGSQHCYYIVFADNTTVPISVIAISIALALMALVTVTLICACQRYCPTSRGLLAEAPQVSTEEWCSLSHQVTTASLLPLICQWNVATTPIHTSLVISMGLDTCLIHQACMSTSWQPASHWVWSVLGPNRVLCLAQLVAVMATSFHPQRDEGWKSVGSIGCRYAHHWCHQTQQCYHQASASHKPISIGQTGENPLLRLHTGIPTVIYVLSGLQGSQTSRLSVLHSSSLNQAVWQHCGRTLGFLLYGSSVCVHAFAVSAWCVFHPLLTKRKRRARPLQPLIQLPLRTVDKTINCTSQSELLLGWLHVSKLHQAQSCCKILVYCLASLLGFAWIGGSSWPAFAHGQWLLC